MSHDLSDLKEFVFLGKLQSRSTFNRDASRVAMKMIWGKESHPE